MRKLRLMIPLVCVVAVLCATMSPATAAAAGLSPPVADCQAHGRLTKHYSPSELRSALTTMPADIAEYTTCPDVINRALLSQLGTLAGGTSSGGDASVLPGWAIAVLVVVALAGAGFGAVALRNRRS